MYIHIACLLTKIDHWHVSQSYSVSPILDLDIKFFQVAIIINLIFSNSCYDKISVTKPFTVFELLINIYIQLST